MATTEGAQRFVLRLTPNDAPPLASSRAHLDRLLAVFTIPAQSDATPETIAAHIVTALELGGRVHLLLEPIDGEW